MNPEKTFFTADTHFGHRAMPDRFRKDLVDVRTHDAHLIEQWNRTVPHDGHTFILGDFSFSRPDRTLEILGTLNGRKYLVTGNHDKLNKLCLSMFEWDKPYHEQKFQVGNVTYNTVMCHYAFRSWNRMGYGSLNLHGHSHANLPRRPRQLDVGIDMAKRLTCDYRPFSLAEVVEILAENPIYAEDHHQPKVASGG